MAITQITSTGIAANQIGSSELDLTANYAFTGTVTGTTQGLKLLATATSTGQSLG